MSILELKTITRDQADEIRYDADTKHIVQDSSRWTVETLAVFKKGDSYYGFIYEEGLTEMQEGIDPYFDEENVHIYPVKRHMVETFTIEK